MPPDGSGTEPEANGTISGDADLPQPATSGTDLTAAPLFADCPNLLASALLAAPYSILITDQKGIIVWVNPAFTDSTGYSADEAVGRTPCILSSGAQPKIFYEKMWSNILAGNAWRGEMVNRRKNGTLYQEEMTITPIRSRKGDIVYFVAIKQDITIRKRYEDRLRLYTFEMARARAQHEERARQLATALDEMRRSDATFQMLFNAIPQAVYVYDQKSLQFLEVNKTAIDRYGYSRDEFLRMKITEIRPPDEIPRLLQLLQEHGSINLKTSGWKHMAKDGRIFDVEVSSHSFRFAGTQAVLVIAQDVTERNRLEVELRHGQKLQAVGSLAAGIAHEINTPIQFIGDNLRFLRDEFPGIANLFARYQQLEQAARLGPIPPQLLDELHAARESCELDYLLSEVPRAMSQSLDGIARVASIVRAMKAFSHPDLGEKTSSDINEGLKTTLIVARNELKYVADVEIDFGDLPPLMCYPGDLNQVFLNLLVNAAQAIGDVVKSSGKKGKIRVATRAEDGFVVVSISDTGCGIPEAIQNRIFEPFFTTKEVGRGTGQGLALARSIVADKHGGTLSFVSQVGVGTTFTIHLPIDSSITESVRNAASS